MSSQPVDVAGSSTPSDASVKGGRDDKSPDETASSPLGLATQETQRMESVLGDAILRFLRIRRRPKAEHDLDAVSAGNDIPYELKFLFLSNPI